jgi:3-(3-hydroxy-phenyl)propionate hydroxylase
MLDAPLTRANGESIFLTESFKSESSKSAGGGFVLVESANGAASDAPRGVGHILIGSDAPLHDCSGLFTRRYGATPGSAYLLRPDGYVAARFKHPTSVAIEQALARAGARGER